MSGPISPFAPLVPPAQLHLSQWIDPVHRLGLHAAWRLLSAMVPGLEVTPDPPSEGVSPDANDTLYGCSPGRADTRRGSGSGPRLPARPGRNRSDGPPYRVRRSRRVVLGQRPG